MRTQTRPAGYAGTAAPPAERGRAAQLLRWMWSGPVHRSQEGWYACNQTPRPIWIEHEEAVFTLAPLERRWFDHDPGARFPELLRLIDRHELVVVPATTGAVDPSMKIATRAWLIVAFLWAVSLWPLSSWWWYRIGAVLGIAACLTLLLLVTRPGPTGQRPDGDPAGPEESVTWNAAGIEVGRRTWNGAVMLAVVAISVLMPAAALYFATELHDLIRISQSGLDIDTSKPLVLIGRLVQLTFMAVATMLPALLYFQFDAERLVTLRDRWMQNVFRLDPTVFTVADVTAKYGRQLEEAYGRPDAGRGRLVRGRRSPIVLATLVLAFGWLLILLRAGATIDGDLGAEEGLFVRLLDPNPSLLTYGFLGAYFFGVQLVWNSYVRADLRPKTYTTVTVRVLVVVVLTWLIDATLTGTQPAEFLYVLAFLAGIVPNTVLHLVTEKVLGRPSLFNRDRLRQLTELEGIDLYERTRLSEEGITSLEALAHHDLLDLFFKTRIAPARLIDWADQAILLMHLGSAEDDAAAGAGRYGGFRDALRAAGVRTATDLVAAGRPGPERARQNCGCADPVRGSSDLDSVVRIVAADLDRSEADVRRRLEVLCATLDRSEWIGRIENWRNSDLIESKLCRRQHVGSSGDLRAGDPRVGPPSCWRLAGDEMSDRGPAAWEVTDEPTHLRG